MGIPYMTEEVYDPEKYAVDLMKLQDIPLSDLLLGLKKAVRVSVNEVW